MTVSRVKEKADRIFECYLHLEVIDGKKTVTYKYPENFDNQDILHNVPVFCFPITNMQAGKYFGFTITNCAESMFSFGYCYTTSATTAICVVSYLPWHDFFHRFVLMVEKIMNVAQYKRNAHEIVGTLYRSPVPPPGPFSFDAGSMLCKLSVPDHQGLVSLSENRNQSTLLPLLNTRCIYTLYMALIMERRIILVSDSLDRCSAAVYAARDLLFPMYWQHVFIPVLPEALIDYVAAPMPLLIGLHKSLEERARRIWGEELVLVDLDNDEMQVPPSLLNEDMLKIPHSIEESVMEGIKGIKKMYENDETRKKIGDKLSKMFCVTLVAIVGNYRGSCRFDNTKSKTFSFDHDNFLHSRPANLQEVVAKLLQCQHFDEFIQERLQIIQGVKPRDAYEELSVDYYQTGSHKNYLKSWINDEIAKEWNPQIARINNGAFAIQGFMSDMNSGTRVSSPKINLGKEMPVTRTAPTKPMPWHLYKNTLVNLPAFLRDNTLPPPTIDEKLFNLMIGNLDHINSNPSINSNKQTGQVEMRRSATISRQVPVQSRTVPPRPVSHHGSLSIPRNLPSKPPPPPHQNTNNSQNEVNVGQLISLGDDD